nr:unnamed protein product [Spirometra erinaceieuropaei]
MRRSAMADLALAPLTMHQSTFRAPEPEEPGGINGYGDGNDDDFSEGGCDSGGVEGSIIECPGRGGGGGDDDDGGGGGGGGGGGDDGGG